VSANPDIFAKHIKLPFSLFPSENFSVEYRDFNSILMCDGFNRNPIQYLLLNSQNNPRFTTT